MVENIIGAPKIRNNLFFSQYCDSNNGFFSIAHFKVIALNLFYLILKSLFLY